MAVNAGKGGGKRKVFYTALCLTKEHGARGHKSGGSHHFVKVEAAKSKKPPKGKGCPECFVNH